MKSPLQLRGKGAQTAFAEGDRTALRFVLAFAGKLQRQPRKRNARIERQNLPE